MPADLPKQLDRRGWGTAPARGLTRRAQRCFAALRMTCMDYRHHHLVSHHRHSVGEAPSQRLGSGRHDERELGYDVRNPYMT